MLMCLVYAHASWVSIRTSTIEQLKIIFVLQVAVVVVEWYVVIAFIMVMVIARHTYCRLEQ